MYLYVFGVAAALAVLTKGPVAIVILLPATVIYLLLLSEFTLLRRYLIHPWVLLFGVVCAPWYTDILARDGRAFFAEFIVHDNIDRIFHPEHQRGRGALPSRGCGPRGLSAGSPLAVVPRYCLMNTRRLWPAARSSAS